MPMDFPDMKSLVQCAKVWKFRELKEGETEESFREALAEFVQPQDLIESQEIRNKVGWDKFTDAQNADMVKRGIKFSGPANLFRVVG